MIMAKRNMNFQSFSCDLCIRLNNRSQHWKWSIWKRYSSIIKNYGKTLKNTVLDVRRKRDATPHTYNVISLKGCQHSGEFIFFNVKKVFARFSHNCHASTSCFLKIFTPSIAWILSVKDNREVLSKRKNDCT